MYSQKLHPNLLVSSGPKFPMVKSCWLLIVREYVGCMVKRDFLPTSCLGLKRFGLPTEPEALGVSCSTHAQLLLSPSSATQSKTQRVIE